MEASHKSDDFPGGVAKGKELDRTESSTFSKEGGSTGNYGTLPRAGNSDNVEERQIQIGANGTSSPAEKDHSSNNSADINPPPEKPMIMDTEQATSGDKNQIQDELYDLRSCYDVYPEDEHATIEMKVSTACDKLVLDEEKLFPPILYEMISKVSKSLGTPIQYVIQPLLSVTANLMNGAFVEMRAPQTNTDKGHVEPVIVNLVVLGNKSTNKTAAFNLIEQEVVVIEKDKIAEAKIRFEEDENDETLMGHSPKIVKMFDSAADGEVLVRTLQSKRCYPQPSSARERGVGVERELLLYFLQIIKEHGIITRISDDKKKVFVPQTGDDLTPEVEEKFTALRQKHPEFKPFN